MRFGAIPTREAVGAILAHARKLADGRKLAKGTVLSADTVEALVQSGVESIVAARLGADDVSENEAAGRIGQALVSSSIECRDASTGRCNLFATRGGLFLPDRRAVDDLNRLDPGITLATLGEFTPVRQGQMVATVKIIPLAVPGAAVADAETLLRRETAFRLAPFEALRIGLIQTLLPALKPSVLDKTKKALEERLLPSGSSIVREVRIEHSEIALSEALGEADEDITIVFGASAIADAEDVIPAALRRSGGSVEHIGMPVDPGNLLLIGRIGNRSIIGAPGCARSPLENGFDWVLNRLLAGLATRSEDLTGMGVGGLLMEIGSRPQPRDRTQTPEGLASPRVEVVVLAAGRSSRMGAANKLLAEFDGVPLVRRTVQTALQAKAAGVHVVVGHEAARIQAALAALDVNILENGRFADGLSTSLIRGFDSAGRDADGVMILLADQPFLSVDDLDRLIAAFTPIGEGSIVMASHDGRRANPVILSTSFADEVRKLTGDVGARSIVAANLSLVRTVEIGEAASFDVDTPDAMQEAGGVLPA